MSNKPTLDAVRDYYGRVLSSSKDLKTTACCSDDALPRHLRALVAALPDEVNERFYGCGAPLPPLLEGMTVLDLGCGSGRDAFVCASLVGERGRVIGVDMTEEQLAVARRHNRHEHVRFLQGYIEDLAAAGVEDASVDVVISNCVLNLSPDKERAFGEILRVLKPGGELYFADVFADRRVPARLCEDPLLYGECLAGALYLDDLRRILQAHGVLDHRVVSARPIAVTDEDIAAKLGPLRFSSVTVRAFKLATLEDRCEDYGQVAIYRGGIEHHEHAFTLDDHHVFERGRAQPVCGNTAAMLSETRYGSRFEILGDRSTHYGAFACGPATTTTTGPANGGVGGACC